MTAATLAFRLPLKRAATVVLCAKSVKWNVDKWSEASGGGGGTPELPPPEIGKFVVEIWCYLPDVYTFGEESNI